MSHSQFHCTGRAYLDMHGLIFETSICYWQDQPGRSARSRGWDRQGPPLARSLAQAREKPGTGAGRAPRRRGHSLRGEASRTTEPAGSGASSDASGSSPGGSPAHTPGTGRGRGGGGGRGDREEGDPEAPAPQTQTHTPPADGADPERRRAREGEPEPARGKGPAPAGRSRRDRTSCPSAPRRGKARGGPEPISATPRPGGHGVGRGGSGWGRGGNQGTPNATQGGRLTVSLLHPAQTDRRPHTRDAGRHTKSTTQRPGGTSHNTPAGLGAHARAPPPPRSHQRHRGGELGG